MFAHESKLYRKLAYDICKGCTQLNVGKRENLRKQILFTRTLNATSL